MPEGGDYALRYFTHRSYSPSKSVLVLSNSATLSSQNTHLERMQLFEPIKHRQQIRILSPFFGDSNPTKRPKTSYRLRKARIGSQGNTLRDALAYLGGFCEPLGLFRCLHYYYTILLSIYHGKKAANG